MNMPQVCTAHYQNVELSDTCRPVSTLLCLEAATLGAGSQEFEYKKGISNTCRQTRDHPPTFHLAIAETRRTIIAIAAGCYVRAA
jgi:hypothetical protein